VTPCFAVRAEILRELMKDPEYAERLEKAREWLEVIAVVREFAEKNGYKFAQIYMAAKP
jgi:hypothetical protein